MSYSTDLRGQRFGRLLVLGLDIPVKGVKHWFCLCDCTKTTSVSTHKLTSNHTKSCGCLQKEVISRIRTTHGERRVGSTSSEYRTWLSLRDRCNNKNSRDFTNYGGRGVQCCSRWDRFEFFLEDMGRKPDSCYSLDRIDNNKGYSPDNCRWATSVEQSSNTRTNVMIEYKGITKPLSAWAREKGIRAGTLRKRLMGLGWPVDKALTEPVYTRRNDV